MTDYSAVLEGSDGAPKIVVRFVVWPKNPEKEFSFLFFANSGLPSSANVSVLSRPECSDHPKTGR